jgi:hypothetical protein
MMQDMIVPKDYTALGVQLQYFVGAVEIFFGSESIAAFEMRRLLHRWAIIIRNSEI